MKLIFDKQGNLLVAGWHVPSSHEGPEFVVAELVYGETFDPRYSYSVNEEGFAVKGELLPVDLEEVARLEAEIAATQYQRDRRSAYPPIEDQLDILYHEGYEGWKAAVQAVKDQFPKGE